MNHHENKDEKTIKLTLGFLKISVSFPCAGINSLTPSFGGSDWDRRCPILLGSAFFAGDLGTFLS